MSISTRVGSDTACMPENVAGRDAIEKVVAAIFISFFDLGEIPSRLNFFDLGGDSLKALILTGEIANTLHVKLPPTLLFEFPSIEGIVSEVMRITAASCQQTTVAVM
jgi:acyl carrier protein